MKTFLGLVVALAVVMGSEIVQAQYCDGVYTSYYGSPVSYGYGYPSYGGYYSAGYSPSYYGYGYSSYYAPAAYSYYSPYYTSYGYYPAYGYRSYYSPWFSWGW